MARKSDFQKQIDEFEKRIQEFDPTEEGQLHDFLSDLMTDIETLRDEQETKKEALPDNFQEAPVGEKLQQRYDRLDEIYDELDDIQSEDFDELSNDDARGEAMDDLDISDDDDEEQKDEDSATWDKLDDKILEKKQDHLSSWLADRIEELHAIDFTIE
jgi:regulator of replication initiation timing